MYAQALRRSCTIRTCFFDLQLYQLLGCGQKPSCEVHLLINKCLFAYIHRSSFSEFAFKYGKDERFKSVEKMREREQLFTDYLAELKKVSKHKEEQKSSKFKEDVVKLRLS